MTDTVIKVENLSKLYRLGLVGTGTLEHDIRRLWYRIRGKEDPYLKIGETNDRSKKGESDYVWALKDINFEVKRGDRIGIIGKNGAGKSTLLKILSQVTGPTTGRIKMKGRVGSLLEVGTGFHPELTGRENIYMNGTILGMKRWEIARKLDEIVDFAGVERYIDTPVKRYSSGMRVRLGFAVAAYLEPDILIVDEVLAVGDAEFQKKAIGKMKDVSEGEGRTILFVSHNLTAVKSLCNRGVLLENGFIKGEDKASRIVEEYLSKSIRKSKSVNCENYLIEREDVDAAITSVKFFDKKNDMTNFFSFNETFFIEIKSFNIMPLRDSCIYIDITNQEGDVCCVVARDSEWNNGEIKKLRAPGDYKFIVEIPAFTFSPGEYWLSVNFHSGNKYFSDLKNILKIIITDSISCRSNASYMWCSSSGVIPEWKVAYNKIDE